MNVYETVCIVKPDLPAAAQKKVDEKIKKILQDNKAELLDEKDWGKRKLAYRVGSFLSGHYFYYYYSGDGRFITELERTLKHDESVFRYLTIQLAKNVDQEEAKNLKRVTTPEEFVLNIQEVYNDRSY